MPTPSNTSQHRFQVNLSGLIDLLSNHLYTRPDVFVRELLQNATDAISARLQIDAGHEGCIDIALDTAAGAFTITDNGIGLTEEEMHRFLAVIGESSKRGDWLGLPQDYIGQFGIGLLACFTVADEIELVSRSATSPDAPRLRWRGRPDGTYGIDTPEQSVQPGTSVRLVAKPSSRPLFAVEALVASARDYGGILPWPIRMAHGTQAQLVNETGNARAFPWDASHLPAALRPAFWLDYGRNTFGTDMLDAVPLASPTGGVDGVAFILKRTLAQNGRSRHRVYLKRMLLSGSVENLLPPWAFFVQCVVNCTRLRPTAARNAFSEDALLRRTQQELGACLRAYLIDLAESHPQRLEELMANHALALKSLALEDDEFFRLFAPWFTLQTSRGQSNLQTYLERNRRIHYTRTVDEFRQISQIAAAQGMEVINGGYTYETELLERYGELHPDTQVDAVQPSDIGHRLLGPSAEEEARCKSFVKAAQAILAPFGCVLRLKTFDPTDLPVLLVLNRDAA
ncbi:MAG: HSP90 family protein, partial [Rhodoferax sp.]|nr:HSP90 family protein [Rhodoferax sp.]